VRDANLDVFVYTVLDRQVHRDGVSALLRPIEYLAWAVLVALMLLMLPFSWVGWLK
jgi:hypothetical protein